MFVGDLEVSEEFPNGFESCEDCVLSSKGMFPEEDLEGGLIFVFVVIEVGV